MKGLCCKAGMEKEPGMKGLRCKGDGERIRNERFVL